MLTSVFFRFFTRLFLADGFFIVHNKMLYVKFSINFLWSRLLSWFPRATIFYYIPTACVTKTVIDFQYFASSIKNTKNIHSSLPIRSAIFLNANDGKSTILNLIYYNKTKCNRIQYWNTLIFWLALIRHNFYLAFSISLGLSNL